MSNYMILGVHGLANKPPKEQHQQAWTSAIQEGLSNIGTPNTIDPSKFQLVYWADRFYPNPILPADDKEPYTSSNSLLSYKQNWLDVYRSKGIGMFSKPMKIAHEWFGLDVISSFILESKLLDLYTYYDSYVDREVLRNIVKQAILNNQDKNIIVVSHSMGSIICYDAIRELGVSINPLVFITIGSPLGFPLISAIIEEEWGDLRIPENMSNWYNFSDKRDPVCFDTHLDDNFISNKIFIKDTIVLNGYVNPEGKSNCHKIYGYLRAPEFSKCLDFYLSLQS